MSHGIEIGPIAPKSFGPYVFDSFEAYQAGRPSAPATGGKMVIRINKNAGKA